MSSSPTSSSSSESDAVPEPLASMLDVTCAVDFVIGTGQLTVRECLRLGRRSIVRLDQVVGGDLQVIVHGVAVAHGEVTITDDSAALRVTSITVPTGVGWE
jgi:flagellar motor switch protein FliN